MRVNKSTLPPIFSRACNGLDPLAMGGVMETRLAVSLLVIILNKRERERGKDKLG